eukprot:CAMPEP_0177578692 /NCGR_PEP_ID=MMETSP0419_2-20121207/496_1 /TAXON_ID=582737 /ORGANISM="Tetraselmis sp., Strain GSL018" /LENGTH=354 /DNA_ID=CAMNT_0019067177 /DNA_START=230 /DNA_END=1295 /DNA_ORIENTATION=-
MMDRGISQGAGDNVENMPQITRSLSVLAEAVDNAALGNAFEGDPSTDGESKSDDEDHADARSNVKIASKVRWRVLRDKVTFVLGLANVATSFFWLGRRPDTFYVWYTLKCIVLFGLRLRFYRKQRLHYYFFDFCYLANALLLLHCWVPALWSSQWLWKALFACCAGPLAWSIPALRNSLVLHDFERTTSVFMHWSPAAVAWALHWYPGSPLHPSYCVGAAECPSRAAGVMELTVAPAAIYLTWNLDLEKKIRERGYDTVYSYMMRKSGMGPLFEGLRPATRPAAYLSLHCACCFICFALSHVFWVSFWAHTVMLVAVSAAAVWNGSCFYFDYFAFRYAPSLGLEHRAGGRAKAE